MFWLFSFLGALLFAALLTLVLGKAFGRNEEFPPQLDFPAKEQPWKAVTTAPINAQSVSDVTFALAFRGYDQRQVDTYLERVEARLADLEQQLSATPATNSLPVGEYPVSTAEEHSE